MRTGKRILIGAAALALEAAGNTLAATHTLRLRGGIAPTSASGDLARPFNKSELVLDDGTAWAFEWDIRGPGHWAGLVTASTLDYPSEIRPPGHAAGSVHGYAIGAGATWHFRKPARVDPYVALGANLRGWHGQISGDGVQVSADGLAGCDFGFGKSGRFGLSAALSGSTAKARLKLGPNGFEVPVHPVTLTLGVRWRLSKSEGP